MRILHRLWRGELALGHAFWNWAVIGGLAVNAASSALFLVLIANGRPIAALIAGYAPSIPYNIIAAVGVWRAAGHYPGDRRWADLARIATIIGMVLLTLT
jgi:hypothetical protein